MFAQQHTDRTRQASLNMPGTMQAELGVDMRPYLIGAAAIRSSLVSLS